MIEHIVAILKARGQVGWPWKLRHQDHFAEAKVFWSVAGEDNPFIVDHPREGSKSYATPEDAAGQFVEIVFTPRNLGLVYEGIRAHQLNQGKDFDDLEPGELEKLCRLYVKRFFYQDYPFMKKDDR